MHALRQGVVQVSLKSLVQTPGVVQLPMQCQHYLTTVLPQVPRRLTGFRRLPVPIFPCLSGCHPRPCPIALGVPLPSSVPHVLYDRLRVLDPLRAVFDDLLCFHNMRLVLSFLPRRL
jgi:hypothetical protein